MNKFGRLTFFTFCIFFNSLITQIDAQPPKRDLVNHQANQKTLTLKLRDLYFKRDFEGGYELGKNSVNQFPNNIELQAWFILNMARNEMSREAIEPAKELTDKNKDNGWAWFALANAYYRNGQYEESLPASEKALAIDPKNEEFIYMQGLALSGLKRYVESYAFFDKNSAKIKDKSRILYTNGESLYLQSQMSPDKIDEAMRKQSFENFAQSLKLNPNSVNANFVYGLYLNREKRFDEALPILKKAAQLSPDVSQIRLELWKSIQGQANKTDEQKNTELIADFDVMLKANPNSPKFLAVVAEQYDSLKNTEKRDFYENQILEKFPDTKFAESIQYNRINRFESEMAKGVDINKIQEALTKMSEAKTPADFAKLKDLLGNAKEREAATEKINKMRWDFIHRPTHFDEKKLGNVYFTLLQQSGANRNMTDDQLSELIEGSLKYKKDKYTNVNSQLAEVLINGKIFHPNSRFNNDAEKYARAGVEEAETSIVTLPKNTSAEMLNSVRGFAVNTLGFVLMRENKLDEAEEKLLSVQKMFPDPSPNARIMSLTFSNNRNLAELYETKKDYDKAEEYLLRNAEGRSIELIGFKNLYKKRSNGNTEGMDAYLKIITKKINVKLKDRLIASRIKNPKDAVPFSLKTIDGKTISYDELKGKVIVINFWGTWCAPCVAEMPELQQLYKKYENDKDVAIITMDTNDEPETVKKFMADKKYEFPVLFGDSYTGNIFFNGSIAFPTTLFISKQGKVEFIKVSNSAKLFEEFGWRIEALKQDK